MGYGRRPSSAVTPVGEEPSLRKPAETAENELGFCVFAFGGEELYTPYFSRTRVPLIFWLLSVLRKLGMIWSINSKYEDSAGVFCCGL
jgi:hypothetical protein